MNISFTKNLVVFSTDFSDEFELLQKFIGVKPVKAYYNTPVDFHAAGLKYKTKRDIWHIDIPLVYSTDEAPPLTVNGKWLGENHIFPFSLIKFYATTRQKASIECAKNKSASSARFVQTYEFPFFCIHL